MDEFAHFRSGIEKVLELAHAPHFTDQDRERLHMAVKQHRTGQGPVPLLIPELERLRDRPVKLLDDADKELTPDHVLDLEELIQTATSL